jgi:uncharacterized membrane protein
MVNSDADRTMRAIVVLFVVAIVAIPVLMLVAMGLDGWDNDSVGMMGSWGGAWGLMMVIPGAVFLVVLLVIVLAVLSDRPAVQAQDSSLVLPLSTRH